VTKVVSSEQSKHAGVRGASKDSATFSANTTVALETHGHKIRLRYFLRPVVVYPTTKGYFRKADLPSFLAAFQVFNQCRLKSRSGSKSLNKKCLCRFSNIAVDCSTIHAGCRACLADAEAAALASDRDNCHLEVSTVHLRVAILLEEAQSSLIERRALSLKFVELLEWKIWFFFDKVVLLTCPWSVKTSELPHGWDQARPMCPVENCLTKSRQNRIKRRYIWSKLNQIRGSIHLVWFDSINRPSSNGQKCLGFIRTTMF
jgi:hypothetical protein